MESVNFVIRDALESDIEACLALDHHYETEYVWQMSIMPYPEGWQVSFRKERLPRPVEALYASNVERLKLALAPDKCFIVAVTKDESQRMLAYLTMSLDPSHQIALVQDLVVSKAFRRNKVGSRLLAVAQQWASQREMRQLLIETQTKNYPSIEFCQRRGFSFCGFNDQYFRNQDIAVFFGRALR